MGETGADMNPMEGQRETGDAVLMDIQKKIRSAFEIFDHENNQTIDVRELGTVIRSLDCCPTEGELHDMLTECEEEEPTGYIKLDRFETMMSRTLMEHKYRPAPEEKIMRALEILDTDRKGYLTVEEISNYVTKEGEPFSQEELDEMLNGAVDSEKGVINYKDYAMKLAVDDAES
ncbi:dynein regulatory complex protein 8-like [Symsagittifera roscoffensis]|uniref:dynein regulatory complex protein 8-like n=1 Tax=Symsagittifera roscoffensis TaxID=84072 RepID=UPI00307C6CD6